MVYNPSLRQEPRSKPAAVIPTKPESSLLDWLESSGRLLARDSQDFDYSDAEAEISELMAGDDGSYDADDDDDDDDLDLDD